MTYSKFIILLLLFTFSSCKKDNRSEDQQMISSQDDSLLKIWKWGNITIPSYSWPAGTAFGEGLFIDTAFDPEGISIHGGEIRFHVDPINPAPPQDAPSEFNYRSEIHTTPWNINHPLGTEQWFGWQYTFGDNYVIDPTSPITIFQNHPGVTGESPQFELELAALNSPAPALGGELQIVNEASSDRIVLDIKPEAGESIDIVIHVVYGLGAEGLLQIWLNETLYYDEQTSTVYQAYPWGGNNKWGIYHHTFNNSSSDVQSSLDIGAGPMDLYMNALRLITRTPDHAEYKIDAYDLVKP